MSAHRIAFDLFKAAVDGFVGIPDPGDTNTITVNVSPAYVELVTAAAETRTLADPTAGGQELVLTLKTDGGTCTITASSAYDQSGSTSLTFDDVNDSVRFYSITDGSGTFAWRVAGSDGVGGIVTETSGFDLNGVADAGIMDADGDTTISAPTDDQIDVELGGVDHVVLKSVAAADAATTTSIQEIAFTSPVDTTGTNTHNGITIDLTIGNASGGTNTVNGIAFDNITGDAQVIENALNIGSGWASGIAFQAAAASYATLLTDVNDNEVLETQAIASAVNHVGISNAATGNAAIIEALGGDTDVGFDLTPKGTGDVNLVSGHVIMGDGGTVTQATDINTTVVLNTESGQITTVSTTLAAGVDATFTVTNSAVAAQDVVICNTGSYGGTADGIPICNTESVGAGTFDINIRNTGAVALDAVVVINFAVVGGSAT